MPKPKYNSIEELNNYLKESCESRRKQKHHKDAGTIGEVVIKEQESFLKSNRDSYHHWPFLGQNWPKPCGKNHL